MENERNYMGHTIKLQNDWSFIVEGPEFPASRYVAKFGSFDAAKQEIEKRVTERNKIEAQGIKLYLALLNDKAEPVTITGINRNTGEMGAGTEFYPRVRWVVEALVRRNALAEELKEITNKLGLIEIRGKRAYGRIDAERYAGYIKDLEKEVAEKTELANKTAELKIADAS